MLLVYYYHKSSKYFKGGFIGYILHFIWIFQKEVIIFLFMREEY